MFIYKERCKDNKSFHSWQLFLVKKSFSYKEKFYFLTQRRRERGGASLYLSLAKKGRIKEKASPNFRKFRGSKPSKLFYV